MEYVELANGIKMPAIGFGTAQIRSDQCTEAVKNALREGYRIIDTASQYKNEEAVGKGVREYKAIRDKIIVSTKLWNDSHGYEKTFRAYEDSVRWMGLDTFDMFLIHWPNPKLLRSQGYENHNSESWRAMEELYEKNKLKIIGVSNFQIHHLEALIKTSRIKPMVNQICVFPGHVDWKLINFCREKGIIIEAYCPLATGKILNNQILLNISSKYGKSVAQIVLRWHIQNGIIPIPKSINVERIRSNIDVFDFSLSDEDMTDINSIKSDIRILPEPDEADF